MSWWVKPLKTHNVRVFDEPHTNRTLALVPLPGPIHSNWNHTVHLWNRGKL